MERLTMESDKSGLAFTFDLDVTCKREEMLKIVKLGSLLKSYEDTGLSPDICKNYKLFEDELISNDITFDELLRYIDKLKTAKSCEVSDEWIPVKERLPDKFVTKYGNIINRSDEVLVLVNYIKFPNEEGEIHIGVFDHNLYETYQDDIEENGEPFDFDIEKESWRVYEKGVTTPFVDLHNKQIIAWQPLPKPYKGE